MEIWNGTYCIPHIVHELMKINVFSVFGFLVLSITAAVAAAMFAVFFKQTVNFHWLLARSFFLSFIPVIDSLCFGFVFIVNWFGLI